MSTYENTATKLDVYQRVTDSIVNAIEQGAGQYRMPWVVRQDKGFSPISIATVKPYRGINTLVLWAQSQSKGYTSALWGTYQQWQSISGQVRKGEHGSPVVYWGSYESKDTPKGEKDEHEGRNLFCKGYTVFNLDQVDGCKLPKRFEPTLSHNQRIERAESLFAGVGVQVRDGGNRAYYRPDTPEAVYMPGFDQFPDRVDYYSTLAHETTHNADFGIMPRPSLILRLAREKSISWSE
jgi:antirestriction protein ArdC